MCKFNAKIELQPTSQPHISEVYLHLDDKVVFIGKLNNTDEGTFHTFRSEKHVFHKTMSMGLSYTLLSDPIISFKWITIDFCGRKLVSTRRYFLKKGKFMQFPGYELQVFVPIKELDVNIARKFEEDESEGREAI